MMADPLTPHDLDAERSVLGALLLDPHAVPAAAAILTPDDFFRDAHRRIFQHAQALHTRGTAIDLITLRYALTVSGELDAVGGPAYLAALADGMPHSGNVVHYAQIVKEASRARILIAYCRQAIDTFAIDPTVLSNGAGHRFLTAVRGMVEEAHSSTGLDPAALADAVTVIAEGQQIAEQGIPYAVEGMIPNYGMLGMLVAYAKVGKTTLGQALAAAVAMGRPFLGRTTTQTRVLVIAAEDPPEYTAYLARTLAVTDACLTFYRSSIILNDTGLRAIQETVRAGGYGLVLIATWQAVIRGLVKDENDNAGAANVVGAVKDTARATGIPWLIDAHSGKGEDQEDDADPSRAMRGASSAPGAADYTLSLRYAKGPFSTQRRLSGKGRFVNLAPLTLDYDPQTGAYTCLGSTKTAATETTWRLICETGALDTTPRSLTEIARVSGLIAADARLGGNHRTQLSNALANRSEVGRVEENRRGHKTTLYRRLEDQ